MCIRDSSSPFWTNGPWKAGGSRAVLNINMLYRRRDWGRGQEIPGTGIYLSCVYYSPKYNRAGPAKKRIKLVRA